jgi:hypothetical protein
MAKVGRGITSFTDVRPEVTVTIEHLHLRWRRAQD